MTPTQRTLKYLRDNGWTAGVVEKWNPHCRIRQDFFGCIDIIAVRENRTIGVQATASGVASRVAKIHGEPRSRAWIAGGNELWVMGWRKLKVKRGGKAMRWTPRIVEIKPEAV